MIRVDSSNPHSSVERSHISVPEKSYARLLTQRSLSASEMRKAAAVYVGNTKVYPDGFHYTMKYRARNEFLFRESSGKTVTGCVEDTVRIDTAYPMYVKTQPLLAPQPYFTNGSASPNGSAEIYGGFSGSELLLTPVCGLYSAVPNSGEYASTGSHWYYGTSLYQDYTDTEITINTFYIPTLPELGFRYIVHRTVSTNTVLSGGDGGSTVYSFSGRMTRYPYKPGDEIIKGLYANTQMIGKELKISKSAYRYYPIGFSYRRNDPVGEDGAFLIMPLCHLYNASSDDSILVGEDSSGSSRYSPGLYGVRYWLCYSLYAPPFQGHKHFDGYYRYNWFNPGREIWDDAHCTSWTHTDMDGTVEIIENTNPAFSSIGDYVNSYFH